MAANFDNSAWFYDGLSRVVYGRAIVSAQVYLLKHIQPNAQILIAGGGTGWILEEITKLYPSGLTITYAEVSANMIKLAQQRNAGQNQVIFINKAIEDAGLTTQFDIVITSFLFDNLTEQSLTTVFKCINYLLKPGGLWLNTNFQLTGKWWQAVLLKAMFIFFKMVCHIEASKLPPIKQAFRHNNYQRIDEQTFFGEFIVSQVYYK